MLQVVVPARAELLEKSFACQECSCSGFKSQSNLRLHLIKVHKKSDISLRQPQVSQQVCYYCPEENCTYNRQRNLREHTDNFFRELRALKQHFVKVHKERTFECKNCSKAFPNEFALRRHEKGCGFKLFCAACGASYRNQPSLTLHVKQKGHLFKWSDFETVWERYGPEEPKKKGSRRRNAAIQTETRKRGVSQTTQTSRTAKKKKLTPAAADSVQTQTLPISSIFADASYTDTSCQTSLPSSSHIETQTSERDVFLSAAQQADSDSSTDLLLFNNMHTQTTEEFLSEFTDIQTQTNWDTEFDLCSDYLVSTETQTTRPLLQSLESTSSYTQTHMDLLYDYTSSHTQT